MWDAREGNGEKCLELEGVQGCINEGTMDAPKARLFDALFGSEEPKGHGHWWEMRCREGFFAPLYRMISDGGSEARTGRGALKVLFELLLDHNTSDVFVCCQGVFMATLLCCKVQSDERETGVISCRAIDLLYALHLRICHAVLERENSGTHDQGDRRTGKSVGAFKGLRMGGTGGDATRVEVEIVLGLCRISRSKHMLAHTRGELMGEGDAQEDESPRVAAATAELDYALLSLERVMLSKHMAALSGEEWGLCFEEGLAALVGAFAAGRACICVHTCRVVRGGCVRVRGVRGQGPALPTFECLHHVNACIHTHLPTLAQTGESFSKRACFVSG